MRPERNGFFYNRDNLPAPKGVKQVLKQKPVWRTIGGPIKKDKLFFFGSYQGTRQRNGVSGGGSASPILPPIPSGDRSPPGSVLRSAGPCVPRTIPVIRHISPDSESSRFKCRWLATVQYQQRA